MTCIKIGFVAACISVLAGCGGGGGGGGGSAAPVSASTTFTGAAAVGELVTYTMDTGNLTYSYTIVESQYGLTGRTGSGSLVANADGTYSMSNIPNSKAIILKNGMLVAAIRESFNGVTKTVPIFGVSNPLSSLASAAGTYNYVSYQCPTLNCSAIAATTSYGTFRINNDGTWISCPQTNYDTNPLGCVAGLNGTLNSLGAGKWQLLHNGGGVMGTALAYTASNGQNVMMVDLKDPAHFGYGIVVGSSIAAITSTDVNGTWKEGVFGKASGTSIYGSEDLTITGGNSVTASNIIVNGVAVTDATQTFTLNTPWNGWVTASTGGTPVMMAGTGMFARSDSGTSSGTPWDLIGLGFKM